MKEPKPSINATRDEFHARITGLSDRERCMCAVWRACEEGYPVVPLEVADTISHGSGMRPNSPNGVMDATVDFGKFIRVVGSRPNFNIGLATGRKYELVALHVDPRVDGGRAFRWFLREFRGLPKGPQILVPDGTWYMLFVWPDECDIDTHQLHPGLQVIGNEDCIPMPPSKDASGSKYRWADGRSIWDHGILEFRKSWLEAMPETANELHDGDELDEVAELSGPED